jgi:hypothetical protein
MNEKTNGQVGFRVPHGKELETILRNAGRQARLMHKKLGNPIASWQDGKVVIIPPQEILVEDDDEPAD